jgi:PPP family 3-phenylpropionic acid transporter
VSPTPPTLDQPSLVRPAIVYFALFGSVAAYFPYISVFYRSIGLSLGEIGLLSALSAAVALVSAPLWGAVVDRGFDVRWALAIAGLWTAVAGAWLAVSRDPLVVTAAVVTLGAGSAGMGPILDSRTIELVGSDRDRYGRARAWGSLAFMGFALAVGVLIERVGPPGLFLVYVPGIALTGLIAWALLGRRAAPGRPVTRTRPIGFGAGLAGLVRDPPLLLFFIGSVLLWTAVSAVTTFLSVHLVDLGAEGSLIGLVWTPGALVEVPLMLAFPAIARRVGAERLLVLGGLAFAIRAAVWAAVSDPALYIVTAPLGGIGYAFFYVGTVTYVSRAVPPTVQATAQGIFSGTAFSLGSILGSVVGGFLAGPLSIPGLFAVSAAGTAAGALIVLRATGEGRGRKTAPAGRGVP